ncbi:MAG: acyl-ACP desaturase [Actinomycetota bacterium]
MSDPSIAKEELLRQLLPTVETALNRHQTAAVEWFPHDYVPYERGRNYIEEPWVPSDSDLPDMAKTALEVNLLTEDNLPYYQLALWRTFGNDEAWGDWVRQWTAEEGRHAIAIRDYLTVTRGLDPAVLDRGRMDMALRGWYPNFAEIGPVDGVVFTTIQELATRISHRNTGMITDDPGAERLCARIATDENLHYVFYRDLAAATIQVDPSAVMLAIKRQVTNFQMPGVDMPGFADKAKQMARAGVYNVRIHVEQVLRPILEKHWRLGEIEGLTDEAKQAREDIFHHLDRLERIATRLGESLGPVRVDISSDPVGD